MAVNEAMPFRMERLGVIMEPDPKNPPTPSPPPRA
jgi:hypothetical protein